MASAENFNFSLFDLSSFVTKIRSLNSLLRKFGNFPIWSMEILCFSSIAKFYWLNGAINKIHFFSLFDCFHKITWKKIRA